MNHKSQSYGSRFMKKEFFWEEVVFENKVLFYKVCKQINLGQAPEKNEPIVVCEFNQSNSTMFLKLKLH